MRVFVAGATGVIGSALVPRLVAAGHEVTGMTRTEAHAGPLREAGATPVGRDLFDAEGVREAVRVAAPQVVVHQVTAMPARLDLDDPASLEATSRIRRDGTRILVDAARGAGARRFVAQSIAFYYEPSGDLVKDEDAPTWAEPPEPFLDAVEALRTHEQAVTGAEGLEGLVLRYGMFYGPGTWYARDGWVAELMRRRRFPVVGGGGGIVSFVHVEDAANATVAAVESGSPGTYNVVDDDPAPFREWLPAYAEELGTKRPRRVPKWLARRVAGPTTAEVMTVSRGADNAKAKRELDWTPAHPTWRGGFL